MLIGSDGDGGELVDVDNVPITFVTACHVAFANGLVHFTGWQETETGEKRIVVRTVLPELAVRQMVGQIVAKLPKQN